ncbi:hypothetical protein BDQ12DRAFT_448021 [Crucibulum laeve]|uniref:Uncharacterized protein n=1 Tax=Crucibulum laeve TaxID=68775 RepID=A0A5C3LLK4_9AGAR|nr:hypothetical protein BDQ12DRAFT_448021 [Crucibulum laeve]
MSEIIVQSCILQLKAKSGMQLSFKGRIQKLKQVLPVGISLVIPLVFLYLKLDLNETISTDVHSSTQNTDLLSSKHAPSLLTFLLLPTLLVLALAPFPVLRRRTISTLFLISMFRAMRSTALAPLPAERP